MATEDQEPGVSLCPQAGESLADMAKSTDRARRAIAAGSPDCPIECLGSLVLEFPHLVLANPVFRLSLAADPGLLTSWQPESLAILATSSDGKLAEAASRIASTSRPDWLPRFLSWWRARGRPPFDATACSVALRAAPCALPLEIEQRLRSLAHLAAVAGYQEVKLVEWCDGIGSSGTESKGIATDSGEESELDACWQELMSVAIDAFEPSRDRRERWLRIRQRDAVEIGIEDLSQLGFEVVLESADSPAVFVNDLNHVEPRVPACRDGIVAAWARASAIAGSLEQDGILVWASSRTIEIAGLFEAADVDGPVIASLQASLCDEGADDFRDFDEEDEQGAVGRIVAQSVHDATPDLMTEYLEDVEIERVADPESAMALASLAKEILRNAFGEPSDEIGQVSIGEDADVAMIFIDGRLDRVFGFGAHQRTFQAGCRVELDEVTPRTLIVSVGSNGAPLFATPETAEATIAAIEALRAARTWGQFLDALPPQLATSVRNCFEEGELPVANEEFDPSDVPGYEDGDFPASINSTMLKELPESVVTKFGRKSDTVLNGPSVEFRAADLPAILGALRAMGIKVVERPGLALEMP